MADDEDRDAGARQDGETGMPLALALPGQELELVSISGGRRFQHRMVEMGLARGVRFSVVASGRPGPFILQLKDTRLVLGRAMSDRLFVRPV